MNRLMEITQSLGLRLRAWQVVYMVFFAVFGTAANLYTGEFQVLVSWIYLITSVCSLFIVLPNFRRALFHRNDVLRAHRFSGQFWPIVGWRVYLYIIIPMWFVMVLQLVSAITSSLLQFDQSNVSPHPSVAAYITPFLAGMEEVWRWSMIATVVVIGRWLLQRKWNSNTVRVTVFAIAFLASSFGFGAGHILEFGSHRLRALFLFSGLGALLALMAIFTGRILLVMCVHIAYDLWVTLLSTVTGFDAVFGLVVYVSLLLAPIVTLLWRKQIFRSDTRYEKTKME